MQDDQAAESPRRARGRPKAWDDKTEQNTIKSLDRAMTVFEYLGQLLIVDCGVLFPGHDEPGVDLILPDLRGYGDSSKPKEAQAASHHADD